MFEHMTADRTANAIIMQATSSDKTFVIVEGMKDYKLYNKFLDVHNQVEIKQVGGKDNVQQVIQILNEREFNSKVGIIDSDFSKILNDEVDVENLFLTDFHDSEVMMFESPALEIVLSMYVTKEKLEKFLAKREIRELIIKLAKEIGVLKLANYVHSLGLAFKPKNIDNKPLKYKDFIDDKTLDFKGREQLIQTVRNYSFNRSNSVAEIDVIKEKIDEISNSEYELVQLVNGHDLTNIICHLLKKALGCNNKSLQDYNSIEDALIMSYEARYWIKTELFQKLYEWAESNDENLFREDIKELYRTLNPVGA
ncbi:DUF4435 domain-containing protein [Bacillus thuringiensis]|uniref:DUF4435 domain-containing protein n=1 Tax=Bacillus thuringiensis TaxID=1428 RepID=UPI000BF3C119|nr:DUF4435 domain-containing protein [Bacillus thuringiensis]PEW28197.1 hypothetical protein CN427_12605 [Bacillus thuringiensis]